jgi:hypothetical protein
MRRRVWKSAGRLPALVAALGAVALLLGSPSNESLSASRFAPTPNGPIYGGIPGALPPHFAYIQNGNYRGWPISPKHSQHPVRGSFLDPRGKDDTATSGYHFGIDISVDDANPEAGAVARFSHRVYAVESGTVSEPASDLVHPCLDRRLEVGHFAYWHVSPIVSLGQRVRAGQQIGWSCRGVWHVHLSEWQPDKGNRVWVNPLHRGSPLSPYADTAAPVVNALVFVTPPKQPWLPTVTLAQPDTSTVLPADRLHGLVELRANIADPQSFAGFLARNPAWPTPFTPFRVVVEIQASQTGRPVMSRTSFRADQMPQTPYIVHYAPGTIENDNPQECFGPPAKPHCAGIYWLRPFSRFHEEYWNTRAVPNGLYAVTVRAYDVQGNHAAKTITVTVKN